MNFTASASPKSDQDSSSSEESGSSNSEPPSSSTELVVIPKKQVQRTSLIMTLLKSLFKRRNGATTIRENLADVLSDQSSASEGFSPEEKAMLNSILRLQDIRVEDIMVPRADILSVEIDTTLGDLLRVFEESGHSRMPVYEDTLDDPRGMVHIRDVVAHITGLSKSKRSSNGKRRTTATGELDLKNVDLSKTIEELKLIRAVLFVPPSMLATDLMAKMQASRIQMALVIDEYGGTDGLASLEDIVEVIVGDIEDEHDSDEDLITDKGDGVFLCDARAELEDVEKAIGETFDAGELAEEMDTIGGLVFALIGRVPVRGEVIEGFGYEFRVRDADPRRIKHIELTKAKRRRTRPAVPIPTQS